MKTILLATDFSPNAQRAARFAGQLAYDQNATLILFHAFHIWPDNPAKTGDFALSVQAARDDAEKRIQKEAAELRDLLGAGVPIHSLVEEGHTMNAIRDATKTEKADLLVMSTVGTAPRSAQLLGSVATAMVVETNVPLLLIPPNISYAGLKNVVLCLNPDRPLNAVTFDKTIGFANLFRCVLNVLCISDKVSDTETHERTEHVRRLLSQHPHTLTIETGKFIPSTLLAFAHANKADLIMMLPQTRSWFWKLLEEGETQHLARLTDLPLLAVV